MPPRPALRGNGIHSLGRMVDGRIGNAEKTVPMGWLLTPSMPSKKKSAIGTWCNTHNTKFPDTKFDKLPPTACFAELMTLTAFFLTRPLVLFVGG